MALRDGSQGPEFCFFLFENIEFQMNKCIEHLVSAESNSQPTRAFEHCFLNRCFISLHLCFGFSWCGVPVVCDVDLLFVIELRKMRLWGQ